MKISTAVVEASLSNLWKTCWEVPATLMAHGLPKAGYFLIKPAFSVTCEPVYRLRRFFCARSFHRYPRFMLTLLCASCAPPVENIANVMSCQVSRGLFKE